MQCERVLPANSLSAYGVRGPGLGRTSRGSQGSSSSVGIGGICRSLGLLGDRHKDGLTLSDQPEIVVRVSDGRLPQQKIESA